MLSPVGAAIGTSLRRCFWRGTVTRRPGFRRVSWRGVQGVGVRKRILGGSKVEALAVLGPVGAAMGTSLLRCLWRGIVMRRPGFWRVAWRGWRGGWRTQADLGRKQSEVSVVLGPAGVAMGTSLGRCFWRGIVTRRPGFCRMSWRGLQTGWCTQADLGRKQGRGLGGAWPGGCGNGDFAASMLLARDCDAAARVPSSVTARSARPRSWWCLARC